MPLVEFTEKVKTKTVCIAPGRKGAKKTDIGARFAGYGLKPKLHFESFLSAKPTPISPLTSFAPLRLGAMHDYGFRVWFLHQALSVLL